MNLRHEAHEWDEIKSKLEEVYQKAAKLQTTDTDFLSVIEVLMNKAASNVIRIDDARNERV